MKHAGAIRCYPVPCPSLFCSDITWVCCKILGLLSQLQRGNKPHQTKNHTLYFRPDQNWRTFQVRTGERQVSPLKLSFQNIERIGHLDSSRDPRMSRPATPECQRSVLILLVQYMKNVCTMYEKNYFDIPVFAVMLLYILSAVTFHFIAAKNKSWYWIILDNTNTGYWRQ